jgi:flagellin-like hook-associated protein FlgL
MIASDTLSFARSVAKDLDYAHIQRSEHAKHLSSGKRIVNSGDDAGALSVQIKQSGELRRLQEVKHTLQNAKSYLQARDSALDAVHKIYDRMGTLATMAMDVTKTDQDREKYEIEFQELRTAAMEISREKFNGIHLFRGKEYNLINKEERIDWSSSKAEVDALNASDEYNTHYLATITSEWEQAEIAFQIGEVGINAWLGGNDATNEGDWRWTEGPEGEANNRTGTPFWSGARNGTLMPNMFEKWGHNSSSGLQSEPNNSGGEHYLQISQVLQPDGTRGAWNDLADTTTSGATYQPRGYVRETDQNSLHQQNDEFAGSFEISNGLFQKFIFSSMIGVGTISEARKALGTLDSALEGIVDARAMTGASLSRIDHEIKGLDSKYMQKEKSLGRIEDLDVARAATQLAKAEIKLQSSAQVYEHANTLFSKRNYVEELL